MYVQNSLDSVARNFADYRRSGEQENLTSAYQMISKWKDRNGFEFRYLMRRLINEEVSYEMKSESLKINEAIILKDFSSEVNDEYCKRLLNTEKNWKERNEKIVRMVMHFAKPRSHFWDMTQELSLDMELYNGKFVELEGIVSFPEFSRPKPPV